MFTVLAIIFSIVGFFLFSIGGIERKFEDFRWYNTAGGYCLMVAVVLWCVVFLALIWWTIAWLWVHAP